MTSLGMYIVKVWISVVNERSQPPWVMSNWFFEVMYVYI